jgi:hypothetical protein
MTIVNLLELSEVTGRKRDFNWPLRNASWLSRRAARLQVDDKSDYRTLQVALPLSGKRVYPELSRGIHLHGALLGIYDNNSNV